MEINLGLFWIAFLTDPLAVGLEYEAEYSVPLVIVSYLFAAAGAYVGLLTSAQIRLARSKAESGAWLFAGAAAMGVGIWSMHFLGMVAYKLPMAVHYDVLLTALSILPSIVASVFALNMLSKKTISAPHIVFGSVLLGAGIGSMHYTGMAAMHAEAAMAYDPWLFALSIVVAVVFAFVALSTKVRMKTWFPNIDTRLVNPISASIMGIAISGMHYTAMMAVRFYQGESHTGHAANVNINFLLILINILVFLLIFLVFTALLARKIYANSELVTAIERQKKLEHKLGKNLDLFHTTVENFPGGMSLFDKDLTLMLANQGYYDVLQLDRSRFPAGSTLESLIRCHASRGEYGEGDAEQHISDRLQEARAFEPMKYERVRVSDGAILEFTRAPLPGGGYVQTIIDVTESRKAAEERLSLERELSQAQKMESLGTLASGVAHEINTPIQYIGDNIRFIQDGVADLVELLDVHRQAAEKNLSEEDKAALSAKEEGLDLDFLLEELPGSMSQSLEGIGQVGAIVNAIKEFSHPGQDEMQIIDLNNAIETTLTVSRNQWKYHAEMTTDLADDLPLVKCHQGDINQVVLNMVVNAAHAIEASDRVDGGHISVKTRSNEGFAEIEISDNGSGMSEEVQSRMFDPFFTTKDVGKGTGQGMAICFSIIHQKHGGTIECKSEVGVGTTFIIRVPIEQHGKKEKQVA